MKKTVLMTLALAISFASINAAAKNNSQGGTIIGGVIGAVVGNQFGGGNGKVIATAIGAIVGASIGESIGAQMDRESSQNMTYAQNRGLQYGDRQSSWRGQNYRGDFYVTRSGYYNSIQCRSYRSEIYSYGGQREVRSGTTCYGSNGWYEVHERYVTWQ